MDLATLLTNGPSFTVISQAIMQGEINVWIVPGIEINRRQATITLISVKKRSLKSVVPVPVHVCLTKRGNTHHPGCYRIVTSPCAPG